MNTSLNTYEEVQAAYDEMMSSNSDEMIDPVLMDGYIDYREENSKALRAKTLSEIIKDDKATNRLDQIMIAKFFGVMFATVAVGTMFVNSCDWLVSLI